MAFNKKINTKLFLTIIFLSVLLLSCPVYAYYLDAASNVSSMTPDTFNFTPSENEMAIFAPPTYDYLLPEGHCRWYSDYESGTVTRTPGVDTPEMSIYFSNTWIETAGNFFTNKVTLHSYPDFADYGAYKYVVYGEWVGGNDFHILGSWELYNESPALNCAFTATPISGLAPLEVLFTDASEFTPIGSYWDFGDGYTFSSEVYEPSIQHTFTTTGYYDIKYLAWDTDLNNLDWENKTAYIEVLSTGGNISTGGYTLSVIPASLNYNQNFTLSLSSESGNYTGVKEIKFGWTSPTDSDILYDGEDNTLDYSLSGSNWFQYVDGSFSEDKGTSFPSPITLIPANFGAGIFTIDCYIEKTSGQVIHLTDDLTINTLNQQALTINAVDYETGYLAYSAFQHVFNIGAGTWDNRTNTLSQLYYYPYGQKIYIVLESSSFQTAYKNWTITSEPTDTLDIVMYRGVDTSADNVSLRVNVMDIYSGYLNNVKVTVLNDESLFDSQTKYTNYGGAAVFTVLPSTDYVITASKTGYLSAGKLLDTGTGGNTLDTDIILQLGSNPTATPTSLPTTAAGQYTGGTTAGGNITPVSCRTVLPTGSTLLDTLRNNMACAGISSGANQGYGIALMIIFVLGLIGGKYGKGMGVVMGMASGYVLSLSMGLVPLWTFIAMIIFICLILAIKLWSADGK